MKKTAVGIKPIKMPAPQPSAMDEAFPNFMPSVRAFNDFMSTNVWGPAMSRASGVHPNRARQLVKGLTPRDTSNLKNFTQYLSQVNPALAARAASIYASMGGQGGGLNQHTQQFVGVPQYMQGYTQKAKELMQLEDSIRQKYMTDMPFAGRLLYDLMTPNTYESRKGARGVIDSLKWMLGVPSAKDLQRYMGELQRISRPIGAPTAELWNAAGR